MLINDAGSFPWNLVNGSYGSNIMTQSNTITYSLTSTLNVATMSFTATPSYYAPNTVVNTAFSELYITFSLPSTTIWAPLVYINLQKGGFIPNSFHCQTPTFSLCRVYKKFTRIIIAQFNSLFPAGTDFIMDTLSAFTLYAPSHV